MDRQTQDILHNIELNENSQYDYALYQLLEKNIKDQESVTPRDLMHSMVEDVVQKEKEMR